MKFMSWLIWTLFDTRQLDKSVLVNVAWILTSSVLYMPMVTPPVPVNSNTSVVSFPLPSAGEKEISNTPGPLTTKSLARY